MTLHILKHIKGSSHSLV